MTRAATGVTMHDSSAPRRERHAALVVSTFLIAPVIIGALYSLGASLGLVGAGATGFGVQRLADVLGDGSTWRSVGWTLLTAGSGTALATGAAMLVATALRGTRALRTLLAVPLALPHAAGALAILLLLGQSGILARVAFALGWIDTPSDFPALVYDRPGVGLVVAFAWKEFPFLTLSALAVLETRGDEHEEAARTLGATPAMTLRHVTLPLLWRGIAPAVIAVFAFLLGQYEMAVLLAPSDPLPLSILTYERSTDIDLARRGGAHVLALLALLLAVGLVVFHQRTLDALGEDRR